MTEARTVPRYPEDNAPQPSHTESFLNATCDVARLLMTVSTPDLENLARKLAALRDCGGRLFLIGVGGSAANCSHAAADFRKLCEIEAYSATDNAAELTARTNDEGWDTVFNMWLDTSRMKAKDALLVLSVGGGGRAISANIVKAIDLSKARGAEVFAIVGRPDGYAAKHADLAIVIPQAHPAWVTPLSEAFQAVVWHCLVCHPLLQRNKTTW